MRSRELLPCPRLRPYVRQFWILELEDPVAFGPPERIVPDGLLEVVFHYRTPLICRYDGERFEPQPRSVAVSQTRRFLEIRPVRETGLLSVRFQPWGAYHFFANPVSEIADRQTPTTALWARAATELEERLAEASGDRERIELVERFLLSRLARHRKADVEPLVRAAWRCKGRTSVAGLCRYLGVGERTLQRTTATALGTTPKRLLRLTRFLHACSLLRAGDAPRAEVGLDCGYYDQSHFISELKEFSGLTPRQLAADPAVSWLAFD